MGESTQLILGAEAFCSDGACGEITRVVLDLVTRVVSHVVVEPKHRQGLGRAIPLSLIDFSAHGVLLNCTSAEFDALDHAEETVLLPGTGGRAAYVAGRALPQPYCGLLDVIGKVPQPVTYDTIPPGEVEVRRDEEIEATDGEIGTVRGLVIDQKSGQVTHVLLRQHHLWGHREVPVPLEDVAAIATRIRLNVAKHAVQEMSAGTSARDDDPSRVGP
jgi:sporulation protein YlmC with PRC-barrel domain